jgi:hypothetical protein
MGSVCWRAVPWHQGRSGATVVPGRGAPLGLGGWGQEGGCGGKPGGNPGLWGGFPRVSPRCRAGCARLGVSARSAPCVGVCLGVGPVGWVRAARCAPAPRRGWAGGPPWVAAGLPRRPGCGVRRCGPRGLCAARGWRAGVGGAGPAWARAGPGLVRRGLPFSLLAFGVMVLVVVVSGIPRAAGSAWGVSQLHRLLYLEAAGGASDVLVPVNCCAGSRNRGQTGGEPAGDAGGCTRRAHNGMNLYKPGILAAGTDLPARHAANPGYSDVLPRPPHWRLVRPEPPDPDRHPWTLHRSWQENHIVDCDLAALAGHRLTGPQQVQRVQALIQPPGEHLRDRGARPDPAGHQRPAAVSRIHGSANSQRRPFSPTT